MNDQLQFHTLDPSPRFKCITMWRIIHQTGCSKEEALNRMNVSNFPWAHCYACDEADKSRLTCHRCPVTWPTSTGSCIALINDFEAACDPESRMRFAESILDACASWIPDPTDEVFLPISGYKNIYEVSNFGRVKSLERYAPAGTGQRKVQERIMTHTPNKYDHATVKLSKDGISKTHNVHSLVWQAHIETSQGYAHQSLNYARINFRNSKSPVLHNLYRVVESATLFTV